MAIPNIVPIANNDGETLGTTNKKWSNVHTVDVNLNGVSLTTKLAGIDSKNTTQDTKISTLEGNVSTLSSNKADKTNVYTKAEMNTSLAAKADATATTTALNAKANASDVYTKIDVSQLLDEKLDKSGGELSGDLTVNSTIVRIQNPTTQKNITLESANSGNRGVWDEHMSHWIIVANGSDNAIRVGVSPTADKDNLEVATTSFVCSKIQSGNNEITGSGTITFPKAFPSAPSVVATVQGSSQANLYGCTVYNATSTKFNVYVTRTKSSGGGEAAPQSLTVHWVAMV